MIVFGLTGSIGMGKSRAGVMLKKMGIPVHDSDRAVHAALSPRGAAFEEVAVTFREAWNPKTRTIDRKKLGDLVFHDTAKLRALERILHPAARASQMRFIRTMQKLGRKAVALDIPLLFETGAESRVDYVICVTAPPAIQRRRVMARKGMTEARFDKIRDSQMPDGEKRALSDFVVQTGMGYAHTFQALRKILRIAGVKTE